MSISVPAALALAAQCAPGVAPATLLSLVHAESRFDPLAIGVNGAANPPPARTRTEAAAAARRYIAAGYSVDLGIGQINSRNLAWLGLSVDDAFDPCRNLEAAARVLIGNYLAARRDRAAPRTLDVALSLYNSGDPGRGFRNGYVGRVYRSAAYVVPAIARAAAESAVPTDASIPSGNPLDPTLGRPASAPDGIAGQSIGGIASADPRPRAAPDERAGPPSPPSWDVFVSTRRSSVIVFKGVAQ